MARGAISEKNKKRFTIIGGATLLIVLILYFGVIRSPGSVPDFPESATRESTIPEINTNVFKDGTLDNFKVWSSLPVEVGPTGKENPFSQ